MHASTTTPALLTVIEDYDKIQVDDYQRSYSWGIEEIDEFLDDLRACMKSDESHFFGTFILQAKRENTRECSIVDGQQRLTTVFILVAAIRDRLLGLSTHIIAPEADHMRPIDVKSKVWDFLYPHQNLREHRFESSSYLRDLMRDYVLAENASSNRIPQRKSPVTLAFRKAVNHIRESLRTDLEHFESDGERLEYLNSLLDTLYEKFLVLRVTTENLNESLEIFLTLNNRGLPLGPSDLVRGEILNMRGAGMNEREHTVLQGQMLNQWRDNIVEKVEEPEVFLRHYLVSTGTDTIQKKKIVQEVLNRIRNVEGHPLDRNLWPQRATSFWDELQYYANIYGNILNAEFEGEIGYYLQLLENQAKSHRIFLLAVLDPQIRTEVELEEIVRLTMVLVYRWNMAGKNAQKLENIFQDLSQRWRNGDTFDTIRSLICDEIKEIVLNVNSFIINEAESSFIIKALLHGIHKSTTRGANMISLDRKSLHLEHIAPQSSTQYWLNALLRERASDEDANEKYQQLISQGGNLTLLDGGINQNVGQDSFSEKREEYSKSTIDVSRDLQSFQEWNDRLIEARNIWLAEMFELIFSSEKATNKVVRFSTWWEQRERTRATNS